MAVDQYNRVINYLRVSVTDMCNLRCVYCMPENMTFRPGAALMQNAELLRLLRLFVELGIEKIRFTGGEPTVREGIVDLVRGVARLPGVRRVALTTNGVLLDYLAQPLAAAGLQQVNVSLDSLDPSTFRRITRWGNLRDVLAGIAAAERAGLTVKLNCVVVKGLNDGDDVIEMARLTLQQPWQVRFIEMMPFGGIADFQLTHSVPEASLRQRMAEALGPLEPLHEGRLDGEARVFRLPKAKGTLGFISPVTQPFCTDCNRVRLTADGVLRLCLLRDDEQDLLTPLRQGCKKTQMLELISRAIHAKPWGHGLEKQQFATNRTMSEIGG